MTAYSGSIVPPKAPPKTEIIPVHTSDRGTFKRCRRKWDWSSPMRNNLVSKVSEGGVYMPFWFGSGIHWALRLYYDPALQRDPVETFQTWYDIQWNGGTITEEWLETTYDREPKLSADSFQVEVDLSTMRATTPSVPMYEVRGLYDMLPYADEEEFDLHKELGIGMLKFYKEYAKEHDDFDVIAPEHTFSVPIFDPDGRPLEREDARDGRVKPVHLRGTQDGIIRHRQTGKFGILEHKTAESIGEEYFEKLEKDEQCTTYMYAGQLEALIHDLPYQNLDFVLYNVLRKAYPKPPTLTSRGNISIDRQKESTTVPMLMEAIEMLGLEEFWQKDEKLSSYVEYVREQGDEQFIQRKMVFRNRSELKSCGDRVYMEALDMLEDPRIYPNFVGDWGCKKCAFRGPCIAQDDGSNYEMMLTDSYEKNWTR